MVEDVPDDHIHDLFAALLWGSHPLGRSILGSHEVVAAMDSQKLLEYVQRHYTTERLVVAAAGNLHHDEFVSLWQNAFAGFGQSADSTLERREPQQLTPARRLYPKPLEQVHILQGAYGLPITAKDRYGFLMLNVLLGGNMSSRLFQEIREKRGLAYSVYSYIASYHDSGYLAIYLGVDRDSVQESLALTAREIRGLQNNPVTETELAHARDFVKSGLVLAMENMEAIMTRIARNELYFGKEIPLQEVLDAVDLVRAEDIMRLSSMIFGRQGLTCAGMGPLEKDGIDWAV